MILAYLLALGSSCCTAACSACVKQYDRAAGHIPNSSSRFNLLLALISLAAFAAMGMLGDGLSFHPDVFSYALLRAVGYVLGSFGYLCAVHTGPLLVTVVVSQMGSLIPILYSMIFLQETVTVFTSCGVLLLFIALFCFHYRRGTEKPSPLFFFWVMCSFAGNGLCMLATKLQQTAMPGMFRGEYLFDSTLLVCAVFAVMLLAGDLHTARKTRNVPERRGPETKRLPSGYATGLLWAAVYGLLNAATNYIGTVTAEKLPAVIAFMLSTGFGILLTVFISRFLYREKQSRLQLVACVLAVAGLFLLTVPDFLPVR